MNPATRRPPRPRPAPRGPTPGAAPAAASAAVVVLFNKPYGVLCQFSSDGSGKSTLADWLDVPGFYPAGRLDHDSEGLVVLTADGSLQARIADPRRKLPKTYLAQVEGTPDERQLAALRAGVDLREGRTAPAGARVVPAPADLWPRNPPIRVRQAIPTAWLELVLTEGRNRQVRRMTAAVGLPTLRLIRQAVGAWSIAGLAAGDSRRVAVDRVLPFGPVR